MKEPTEASVAELLAQYRAILAELRRRGVLRTNNAPTGDYAEYLVAAYLNGKLAPNSEKSWDVQVGDGTRIQVKARVVAGGSARGLRQLSTIRSWEFDTLAVLLFDDDFGIARAALIPVDVAKAQARSDAHVNGHRLYATDQLMLAADVTDITESLRVTASNL